MKFSRVYMDSASNRDEHQLERFIESITEMVMKLSKDLEKKVIFKVNNELLNFPYLTTVKNPIIHLIRNAIDHGIEDDFERLTLKKEIPGKIILNFKKNSNFYHIDVIDDGEGINFDLVKKKAIRKKLLNNEEQIDTGKLLKIIFTPSFTSKERASDISGRGIGLDIVKSAMDNIEGKIIVATKRHHGTKFSLKIPAGE